MKGIIYIETPNVVQFVGDSNITGIIVGDGDHFGGAAWANHPDGYEADTTGIATARNLGIRMGEVAARLRG